MNKLIELTPTQFRILMEMLAFELQLLETKLSSPYVKKAHEDYNSTNRKYVELKALYNTLKRGD